MDPAIAKTGPALDGTRKRVRGVESCGGEVVNVAAFNNPEKLEKRLIGVSKRSIYAHTKTRRFVNKVESVHL